MYVCTAVNRAEFWVLCTDTERREQGHPRQIYIKLSQTASQTNTRCWHGAWVPWLIHQQIKLTTGHGATQAHLKLNTAHPKSSRTQSLNEPNLLPLKPLKHFINKQNHCNLPCNTQSSAGVLTLQSERSYRFSLEPDLIYLIHKTDRYTLLCLSLWYSFRVCI